jgi:O-antigen chain-terminating methyltransferase
MTQNIQAAPNELELAVQALPEVYQAIYGHPELSSAASRACEDRFVTIGKIVQALHVKLGRRPRILDLGCAQGYFSIGLAEVGADVDGIDNLPENIRVCTALAVERPELKVQFRFGDVIDVVKRIKSNQYDIVLGLSVFHHIVHGHGLKFVQDLIASVARCVPIGLYELALHSEPPIWAQTQPSDPVSLLSAYNFILKIGEFPTHLSTANRPLYFASNGYWFLHGRIDAFTEFKISPHALAEGVFDGTRRYYVGDKAIAKLFTTTHSRLGVLNRDELTAESNFLQRPIPGFRMPKLVASGESDGLVFIVRELIRGDLLIDFIRSGREYDARKVLLEVLEQLVCLEREGFYHNDLRVWNIVIPPKGKACLIDYGSIGREQKDCVWPHDVMLSFLIFLNELVTATIAGPSPLRIPGFGLSSMPQPYRGIVHSFYTLPREEWTFEKLYMRFKEERESEPKQAPPLSFLGAIQQLEEALLQAVQDAADLSQKSQSKNEAHASDWDTRARQWEERARIAEDRTGQVERQAQDWEARAREWDEKARASHAYAQLLQERIDGAAAHSSDWDTRARQWEERARIAEDRTGHVERQAQDWEARAREWDEKARASQAYAQLLQERIDGAEAHASEWDTRARQWEERARIAEDRTGHVERQAQDWKARAREWDEKARASQAYAQLLQERIDGAEAHASEWDARARQWEERARLAEDRTGQVERQAQDWEARAREWDEKARASQAYAQLLQERIDGAEAHASEWDARARQWEERARLAEDRNGQLERQDQDWKARAREWDEKARASQAYAQQLQERIDGAEAQCQSLTVALRDLEHTLEATTREKNHLDQKLKSISSKWLGRILLSRH